MRFYLETHKTVNTDQKYLWNVIVLQEINQLCEITKRQTAMVISLWFWGLLAYPKLYCDWPVHNQHSWNFSGVQGLMSLTVTCILWTRFFSARPNDLQSLLQAVKNKSFSLTCSTDMQFLETKESFYMRKEVNPHNRHNDLIDNLTSHCSHGYSETEVPFW